MAKARKLGELNAVWRLRSAHPGKRDVLMFDSETRGFGLRVAGSGRQELHRPIPDRDRQAARAHWCVRRFDRGAGSASCTGSG